MQPIARLAALTLSATLLAAVPVVGAVPAVAAVTSGTTSHDAARAGLDWHTIGTSRRARHQACKILVNNGETWKIYNRLVNRPGEAKGGAVMIVQKNGEDTKRNWDSGWIAVGRISGVGAVTIRRGDPRFGLLSGAYSSMGGGAGPLKLSKIGRC